MSDSLQLWPARLLCPWNFPGKNTGVGYHWSGLPFPSPGDLPDPGIKSASPALAGGFFTTVGALSVFLVKMHSLLSMFYSCFKLKLLLPC